MPTFRFNSEKPYFQDAACGRNQNWVVFLLLRYGVAGKKVPYLRGNTMETFLHKYSAYVTGVINGFDRLVLRGNLRRIVYPDGMKCYLHAQRVLLKEFGKHVQRVSTQLKEASTGVASEISRQVIYLGGGKRGHSTFLPRFVGARGVVILMKHILPRIAAVQNVVANPSDETSRGSWHTTMLP